MCDHAALKCRELIDSNIEEIPSNFLIRSEQVLIAVQQRTCLNQFFRQVFIPTQYKILFLHASQMLN